jgi:hypothetical protein
MVLCSPTVQVRDGILNETIAACFRILSVLCSIAINTQRYILHHLKYETIQEQALNKTNMKQSN